jgi:hypothetical protein
MAGIGKPFDRGAASSPELEKIQSAIQRFGKAVSDYQRLNTQQFQITVDSVPTPVTIHDGLGQLPRGWSVVDSTTAPATLYRSSWDAKTLVLASTGASYSATIEVW